MAGRWTSSTRVASGETGSVAAKKCPFDPKEDASTPAPALAPLSAPQPASAPVLARTYMFLLAACGNLGLVLGLRRLFNTQFLITTIATYYCGFAANK